VVKLPSSLRLPCTLISAFQRLCFFDRPTKRDSLSGLAGLLGFCLHPAQSASSCAVEDPQVRHPGAPRRPFTSTELSRYNDISFPVS
jgi:hypothetical protein